MYHNLGGAMWSAIPHPDQQFGAPGTNPFAAAAAAAALQQQQQHHQQQQMLLGSVGLKAPGLTAMAPPQQPLAFSTPTGRAHVGHAAHSGHSGHAFPMLPPASTSTASMRKQKLEQERRNAAALRRLEQQERLQRDRDHSMDLFASRPEKVSGDTSSQQVQQVLGNFNNAHHIINSQTSCIGIDYQPPTPAPARDHHVIDDDELGHGVGHTLGDTHHPARSGAGGMHGEGGSVFPFGVDARLAMGSSLAHPSGHAVESSLSAHPSSPSALRRPPATIRRPPGHMRLPENMDQTHRPHHARAAHETMGPPSLQGQHNRQQQQLPVQPPRGTVSRLPPNSSPNVANNSRLKDASRALPKLSAAPLPLAAASDAASEPELQAILREMRAPLADTAGIVDMVGLADMLPPPLSAIITPRVTEHEGNNSVSVPRYFGTTPMMSTTMSKPRMANGSQQQQEVVRRPVGGQSGQTMHTKANKVHTPTNPEKKDAVPALSSLRNPRLSEDSDSDHDGGDRESAHGAINPMLMEPPLSPAQGTSSLPPTQQPAPATAKHKDSSSSASASSSEEDSSSDEEAAPKAGVPELNDDNSSSDEDKDKHDHDKDEAYSLASMFNKVKSTHSPGPNLLPSPKVQPQMSLKMPFDDEDVNDVEMTYGSDNDAITDMLSQTPQLVDIGQPLSPLDTSEDDNPQTVHETQGASLPAQTIPSSRRRTTSITTKPQMRATARRKQAAQSTDCSSDDDVDEFQYSNRSGGSSSKSRKPRTSRAKLKSRSPSKKEAKKVVSPKKGRAKAPASAATVDTSSDSDDKEDVLTRLRTSSSSGLAPLASKASASSESVSQHSDTNIASVDTANKKNAISRIFALKPKVATSGHGPGSSSGGKGGKGGKGGITVERKATPATPHVHMHVHQAEAAAAGALARRADGRPVFLCTIPLHRIHRKLDTECRTSTSKKRTMSAKSLTSPRDADHHEDTFRKKKIKEEEAGGSTPSASLPGSNPNPVLSRLGSSDLMPPPRKMFDSYLEADGANGESDFSEEAHSLYMQEAKRLKHAADREPNREMQAIRYLQAVLYFSLCGSCNEHRGDKGDAFRMYNETLALIKHVCRPFRNSEVGNFDNKLAVLGFRCQSLLYLKLYKLRRHEFRECQKILGDHIQKAASQQQQHSSPTNGISPTPSPAGSEGSVCSKSSGYTSSGELVLTPPAMAMASASASAAGANGLLSVPQSVMQKQHQYCYFLSQCHDMWEMADLYAHRGRCEDFIIMLDGACGPLTLHSSLKDLVRYVQAGLEHLSKEREKDASSASSSDGQHQHAIAF